MTTMTRMRTNDMEHTFSVHSKKQLMEQLHSEQKEADAITQPLLDTEAGFIKNLELYLNHIDTSALKKRELLHKRWTECVWLPVQRSIKQHFTQHGYNETKNMRSLYTHYINYCNAKGFVFLDSYDPLDYNPFMHHFNRPQHHKVSTPVLLDPLNLQSRGMIKEKMAILRCQTGHVRRSQRVDELLHSFPVYQHRLTQPQAKSSRNTASERIWKDRSLCQPRRRGTPCLSMAKTQPIQPQCLSSYGYRHHVLPSMEMCESISENGALVVPNYYLKCCK